MHQDMNTAHMDRILVVDDQPANLQVLFDLLTRQGYQIRPAMTGELAIKSAQAEPPDLILLDIRLPDMDGYEVCRQLKADSRTCEIPILFLSALDETFDKVKGFQAGAVDYITKPFQPEEVLARVRTHLMLRDLQTQLVRQNAQLTQEVVRRAQTEVELRALNTQLQQANQQQEETNRMLQTVNRELQEAKEAADEARREALEAKNAAEAANRAKSLFLANMSHDLRTPLNAILGYAQILKREKNLTAKQQEQLTTIHSSGEYLLTLISDLLDLSRIEAQKMDLELTAFDLPALLRGIIDASRFKAKARSLFVRYEELSPIPAVVKGDERKLRQVLLNLLTNAVKYTEQGGVTLRVTKATKVEEHPPSPLEGGFQGGVSPQGGNFVPQGTQVEEFPSWEGGGVGSQVSLVTLQFQIEDTGRGIPEEQLEAIFEPFTQMKGEGRPSEGAGLGLAICRRLLEIMGGRLSVASEVGKGSTFTVELDLEVLVEVATAEKATEKAVIGYKGERKRLLIVDDNIINLSMLVSVLDPLGFVIETADSGAEALQKAAATLPDLILLDLLMPGMDGHEVLQRIKKTERLRALKVIGVSAAVADKERAEQFAAACDGFLAKPFDIKELQAQLKEQLQIEWIEEKTEAATALASAGVPPVDEGKPEKWPPQTVVEELLKQTERGDFTRLEKILDRLEVEDKDYRGFCDRIRAYSKRFDDDAIIDYLSQ